MTVFVDDMCDDALGQFGRMKMSHMIADTTDELVIMAYNIGVAGKWLQYPGTHKEHFDIAKSKRALAIKAGAVPITMKQASAMCGCRRLEGALGAPETARERYAALKRPTTMPQAFAAPYKPCSLGVGCDEYGVCYALAHDQPEMCGKA